MLKSQGQYSRNRELIEKPLAVWTVRGPSLFPLATVLVDSKELDMGGWQYSRWWKWEG